MPQQLEAPGNAAELYLSRGTEVNIDRPLMQGDVFADIDIPGVDGGPGVAAILTHPCSMRSDGVHLHERLLVARVDVAHTVPLDQWATGHFKIMPLPDLTPGGAYALKYDLCGRVLSADLQAAVRLACLDPLGICLLLQRLVHHQARLVVPSGDFHSACAAVFEEVELAEDWVGAARAAGEDTEAAVVEFHTMIREDRGGEATFQEALHDPARRAYVRRSVRAMMAERFETNVV